MESIIISSLQAYWLAVMGAVALYIIIYRR